MGLVGYDVSSCSECGSKSLAVDPVRAEVHCRKCGAVILEKLPYVDSFKGAVAVFFGTRTKTIYLKYPNAAKSKKQRSLEPALHELNSVGAALHMMPDARADAMDLYTELYKNGFTRGRNRSRVVAACLLIISREHNHPVLVPEIARLLAVDGGEVLRVARGICIDLDISMKPADAMDFIMRFGQELGLSEFAMTLAMEITYNCKDRLNISYVTLAAACLQLASSIIGSAVPYRHIYSVLGVTPAAMSKAVRCIKRCVDTTPLEKIFILEKSISSS
jgi:transcription initiation factor TFIIIB Brf1 subunit/transcription initiation factor TFIIB